MSLVDFIRWANAALKERERLRFEVDGEEHHLGIVGVEGTRVTINVSSTPQQAVLDVGDEKFFDVNDDGNYDVNVKLDSVVDGEANFVIGEYRGSARVDDGDDVETPRRTEISDAAFWMVMIVVIGLIVLVWISAVVWVYRKRFKKRV